MKLIAFLFPLSLILIGCGSSKPAANFQLPEKPFIDYSKTSSWAALPNKEDNADKSPGGIFEYTSTLEADVFFLHPTTYTGRKGETLWNAPLDDKDLNNRTDESTILHQASIFNGAGKVYAPRYRQAHLYAYYSDDKKSAQAAFELAYRDVKLAFEYYLTHYNKGRPIIIASHSQGTNHATALLKEFFDGKSLQDQLVAAYLVGMPILKKEFKNIPVCETEQQTGCFCSWRTFKKGHLPKNRLVDSDIAVTNPLNWTTSDDYATFDLNQGGVLRNFGKAPRPGLTDAQVKDGILWAAKPRFFGKIFLTFKNYHIADYNLYYVNVRNNAKMRVATFLAKQ